MDFVSIHNIVILKGVPTTTHDHRMESRIKRVHSAIRPKFPYSDHWDSFFLNTTVLRIHSSSMKRMNHMNNRIDLRNLANANLDSNEEGGKAESKQEEARSRKRPALESESESGELESSQDDGCSGPSTKRLKRAFACPYYKNNPQSYSDCREWHNYNIRYVKDHIKKVHLRPHLCDRSSKIYKTGTLKRNLETKSCIKSNVSDSPKMDSSHEDADDLDLESAKTWQEIYISLFPQRIPNKFWKDHDDVD